MSDGKTIREFLGRGAGASWKLGRLRRVRQLLAMEFMTRAQELHYQPGEQFYDDSVDLKRLMRRVFQYLVYNSIRGDYAEFGCYGGRTFTLASGATRLLNHDVHLWAFDSFSGLPPTSDDRDIHAGWTAGAMAMSEADFRARCRANGVPERSFTTVPGFYSDTLAVNAIGPRPERIAFAYVDCDLYTSTRQVLEFLTSRVGNGTVIAFDDYYCYSETHPSGERLAAADVFDEHPRWRLAPYLQWGWNGMSFIVEDRTVSSEPFEVDQ